MSKEQRAKGKEDGPGNGEATVKNDPVDHFRELSDCRIGNKQWSNGRINN